MRRFIILAFGCALAGCTHDLHMRAFKAGSASLTPRESLRVAIVLAPPAVLPQYQTSTDGHSFILKDVPHVLAQAFQGALAGRVGTTGIVTTTPPPAGFDAYVYPRLTVQASGMLQHTCTADLDVSVVDARGGVLGQRRGTGKETFVPIAAADAACNTALVASFNTAAYAALAGLERLPQ